MNLINKFEKEFAVTQKELMYKPSYLNGGYNSANYNTMRVSTIDHLKQAIALKIIITSLAATNPISKLNPAFIKRQFKSDQFVDFMVFIKMNTGDEYLNDNISVCLKSIKYYIRVENFIAAVGGKVFKGSVKKGMNILEEHQPKKYSAILSATEELKSYFNCSIKWNKLCFDIVSTHGRGSYGIGTNVRLMGRTSTGKNIEYEYSQPSNSESGNRMFNYDNGLTKPISQITRYSK